MDLVTFGSCRARERAFTSCGTRRERQVSRQQSCGRKLIWCGGRKTTKKKKKEKRKRTKEHCSVWMNTIRCNVACVCVCVLVAIVARERDFWLSNVNWILFWFCYKLMSHSVILREYWHLHKIPRPTHQCHHHRQVSFCVGILLRKSNGTKLCTLKLIASISRFLTPSSVPLKVESIYRDFWWHISSFVIAKWQRMEKRQGRVQRCERLEERWCDENWE